MSNFFKSKKKPKVDQVDLFNGDVGDHCTDMSIWLFSLPMELAVEMKEKYHIPKYRWVTDNHGKKEILFLDYETIGFNYVLKSYNEDFDSYYIGDDYRTAKSYDGEEYVTLSFAYDCLWDDGYIDVWEGYEGDTYTDSFEEGFEYDYDQPHHPEIEITGNDKKELLKDLHKIMAKIIDGDQKKKDKLYTFNGD